ncbi:MAG: hypothetical protein COB49_11810 [Alphaproteobacteria bacterium]|nr:MAG: hypothetical protein COB49_11810 [Alphaproteobacteria bacterium]
MSTKSSATNFEDAAKLDFSIDQEWLPSAYEDEGNQAVLFKMLLRICRQAYNNCTIAKSLIEWFERNLDVSSDATLGKSIENLIEITEGLGRHRALPFSAQKKFKPAVLELVGHLEKQLAAIVSSADTDNYHRNLSYLAKEIGLDDIETAILELVLNHAFSEKIETLFKYLHDDTKDPTRAIGICLGVLKSEIVDRLKPQGRLISSGLLTVDARCIGFDLGLNICAKVVEEAGQQHATARDFFNAILGKSASATLGKSDFGHIDPALSQLVRLMRGAKKENPSGINILLYGPPGCGKTELCKTVAKLAGVDLFSIGEQNEDGDELTRPGRLSALRFAQHILAHRKNTAILFDEMEDLALHRSPLLFLGHAGSKIHQNRLLEENPVPVLWTCNELSNFDPAFLRRMTFVLEVKSPPPAARVKIWKQILKTQNLQLPSDDIKILAKNSNPSPALISNAAIATRLMGGAAKEFKQVLENSLQITRGSDQDDCNVPVTDHYNPALINADHDLDELLSALRVQAGTPDVSFCLYGPPGTGKSQYARYLADQLQMPVMEKRGSELLNCYVGQTEKMIAAAFKTARDDQAMLVIDEIEMFLSNRAGATQPWHLSQTNEFLTAMERHHQPWCATTNLVDRVDPAAQRRFVYKVKFDYLDAQRAHLAFQSFFDMDAPSGIENLNMLTPSDFALVKRKADLLGHAGDPVQLFKMLKTEVEHKPGRSQRIGF